MPKAKPDQVIVHRLELQETERSILEGLSTAIMFNRIAEPTVKLLNDVTGMVTVLSLLGLSGLLAGVTFTYVFDPDSLKDPLEQFVEQLNQAKERAELVGDALKRGPLWGLIDLLEIYTGANLPDFGGGFENPSSSPGQTYQEAVASGEYNDPTDLYLGVNPTYTSPADVWGGGLGSGSLIV